METLGIWIAVALTFCIFSFLYKDNPFYKFAEHLFVGIAVGYSIVIQAKDGVEGTIIDPMRAAATAGETGEVILIIIPVLVGFLFFAQFVPNYAWLIRIPFALIIAYGAGLTIPAVMEADIFRQVHSTLLAFTTFDQGAWTIFNTLLVFVGIICTLTYFFFSVEHRGFVGGVSKIGITFIMISFGAAFGNTVMGRVSLLIGRVYFLLHDWLHLI
jgi:hypothetical protein